jgi:hypothetical protein
MAIRVIHDKKRVIGIVNVDDPIDMQPIYFIEENTLIEARESMLLQGINSKIIEDALGIDQSATGKLFVSPISAYNGYERKVDLCIMKVCDISEYFTLVFKVKHYISGVYAGNQQPDNIVVLRTDELIGEYPYWINEIHKGPVDLIGQFDYHVKERDKQGRFNKDYAA